MPETRLHALHAGRRVLLQASAMLWKVEPIRHAVLSHRRTKFSASPEAIAPLERQVRDEVGECLGRRPLWGNAVWVRLPSLR